MTTMGDLLMFTSIKSRLIFFITAIVAAVTLVALVFYLQQRPPSFPTRGSEIPPRPDRRSRSRGTVSDASQRLYGSVGSGDQSTAALIVEHLNRVLWEIDDYLRRRGIVEDFTEGDEIIEGILVRIEKEIMGPAGFPDYFLAARGLDAAASVSGHGRYTGAEDHYRALRSRADRMFRRVTLIDLLPLVKPVLEIHNEVIRLFGKMSRP